MTDDALLELAASLATRAGAAILAVRARGFAVERKEDRSPVTEADRAAEAIIVAGLRAAAPEIPVIAEEEMSAGHVATPGPCFWLVDPLDGTREFAAGREGFVVNIGLVRDGRPALGVVGVPSTGTLYGAIAGRGAWRQDATGRQPIAARPPPAEGLTVLASRSHGDTPRLEAFLAGRPVARVEKYGSALKICRLAEGAADLYPRFGRTMEWDTAAPQAILEAAGGSIRTLDGAVLGYGKPGWDNPDFVCAGRGG